MSSPKIGIYGGTFNPPHKGHIHAARTFLDACCLDRLYILPTAIPPHKQTMAGDNPAHRLAMTRLAFADIDARIVVSDYEQTRGGKSYTVLTLEHFRSLSDDLYLLCGTDMFLTLDKWYRGDEILSMAKICCLVREDAAAFAGAAQAVREKAAEYRARFGTEVLLPDYTPLPVSSTQLRDAIRAGGAADAYLTESVKRYIGEHKLYE